MPKYFPSLSERKRVFLETCAGCGDGGGGDGEMYNDGGTAEDSMAMEPE